MEKPAQVSWLSFSEEYEEYKETTPRNYFVNLLRCLNVDENMPGWPDVFGNALQAWATHASGTPIKILSLFSGGGGLDIAFHDAGFNTVQMVEIDPRYVATLQANVTRGSRIEGAKPLCRDIREFDPPEDLQIDFIIGGPPCQTFSAAGRRAAGVAGLDDPRGMLFQEYVRILRKLKPRGFLFENVAGIIGAQEGKAWKEILAAFDSIGYHISYRILDAADYGVPQHRERLIIVGTRENHFAFPRPTHGPDSRGNHYYTPALAIEGVGDEKPGRLGGRYGHLLQDIPPGLNYSFYTEEMGHPTPHFSWRSKFSDLLYKADPVMPVRTIKAQGGQYTGPFHWDNRSFSVGELKRLQTFPDDYALVGGRLLAIQQIGNSVPPQFGRMLAIAVLDQIFGVHFPINIDYLSASEELTFRQNKRLLTELYRKRAREAILKLYGITPMNNAVQQKESSDISEDVEQENIHFACLGPLFSWHVKDDESQRYPWNIRYLTSITTEAIRFLAGNPDSAAKSPCVVIAIHPAQGQGWVLPQETVYLQIQEPTPLLLTAAWKAFEHYLTTQGFKADLVQLNGYYQYEPKIQMKMLKPVLPAYEKASFSYWDVLQQVIEGKGVRQIVSIHSLATRWHLPVEKTIDALTTLRSLGYEVRSEYTNSQIPEGHVLIPYAFPTFSPNSVQQRKVLFPHTFLEQVSLLPANAPHHQGLWSPEQLSQSVHQ